MKFVVYLVRRLQNEENGSNYDKEYRYSRDFCKIKT